MVCVKSLAAPQNMMFEWTSRQHFWLLQTSICRRCQLKIQLWLFKLTMLVDQPHFCHLNSLFSQKTCEPPSLRRTLRKWPRTSQHSCPQWMKISGAKGWREHMQQWAALFGFVPKGNSNDCVVIAQICCHSFSMYRIYFSIFFGRAI